MSELAEQAATYALRIMEQDKELDRLRELIDDAMEYVRYGENPGLYTRMRDALKKRAPDTISLGLDGSRVLKKGATNE